MKLASAVLAGVAGVVLLCPAAGVGWAAEGTPSMWMDQVLSVPYASSSPPDQPTLQLLYQDFERLGLGKNCMGGPMKIGTRPYQHGLGTHANSRIRIFSPDPLGKFTAVVGVENNSVTNPAGHPIGSVVFAVIAGNRELYRSPLMLAGQEAEKIELDVGGSQVLDLLVTDGGNGSPCDWAAWADAAITTVGGKSIPVEQITQGIIAAGVNRYPFSFLYDGRPSDTVLGTWKIERTDPVKQPDGRELSAIRWLEPAGALTITWQVTRFPEYGAADWVLSLREHWASGYGDHRERAGSRPERRDAAAQRRALPAAQDARRHSRSDAV